MEAPGRGMRNTDDQVVITGLGPVTSIGVGNDAVWMSLQSARTGAARRQLQVDIGTTADFPVASMPETELVPGLGEHAEFLIAQHCPGARDLSYALLAAELALADARLEHDRASNSIGFVQVFEAPGVERTARDLFAMMGHAPPPGGPPRVYELLAPAFYNMQPFVYVHLMGKALGLHGFCTSVHNACSSSAFAIETAANVIRSGRADVMIVAGGEAIETAVRLRWFQALDMYATDLGMRPFDSKPSGFLVGEGGGALLLESRRHAESRGAAPYATYLGGAFAHQAWKQTLPDVRAARLAGVIKETLSRAAVKPDALDLIVPHGAATSLSDKYEASCLATAMGDDATHAAGAAFKPSVGHLLAAGGIMDVLFALLTVKHQCVPAMPHPRIDPLPAPMTFAAQCCEQRVDHVLVLSTGFTGHDAATLYRRS